MIIEELISLIGFELDEHSKKTVEHALHSIKEGILGLTLELGGSSLGLYEIVKSTAEVGFETSNLSMALGLTTEQYDRLAFAARAAGVEQTQFSTSMLMLQQRLITARRGNSEEIMALERMGLSMSQIMNRSFGAGNALEAMAEKFKKVKNPAERTTMAVEAFGARAAGRFIRILSHGKEGLQELGDTAQELGLVMTEEQAEMSRQFTVGAEHLGAVITGIKRQIGLGLMPVVKQIVDQIYNFLRVNREIIQQNVGGFIHGVTKVLAAMIGPMKVVATTVMGYIKLFGGAEQATKLFLGALIAVSSLQVLMGMGALLKLMVGFIAQLRLATVWSALLAFFTNLTWAGLAIAIGLLAALVDDYIGYLNGKDSVIGRMIQYFSQTDWLDKLGQAFHRLADQVEQAFDRIGKKYPMIKAVTDLMSAAVRASEGISFGNAPDPQHKGVQKYLEDNKDTKFNWTGVPKQAWDYLTHVDTSGRVGDHGGVSFEQNITNNFPAGSPAAMAGAVGQSAASGGQSAAQTLNKRESAKVY